MTWSRQQRHKAALTGRAARIAGATGAGLASYFGTAAALAAHADAARVVGGPGTLKVEDVPAHFTRCLDCGVPIDPLSPDTYSRYEHTPGAERPEKVGDICASCFRPVGDPQDLER